MMERAGVPLGEYVKGQVYRGVLTGFNKAFVIDGAKREELTARDPRSAEIIKPLSVGKDIRRWAIDRKDRWLIVTQIGTDMNGAWAASGSPSITKSSFAGTGRLRVEPSGPVQSSISLRPRKWFMFSYRKFRRASPSITQGLTQS